MNSYIYVGIAVVIVIIIIFVIYKLIQSKKNKSTLRPIDATVVTNKPTPSASIGQTVSTPIKSTFKKGEPAKQGMIVLDKPGIEYSTYGTDDDLVLKKAQSEAHQNNDASNQEEE